MERDRTRTGEEDAKGTKPAEAGEAKNDCRCEEVSRMTPQQLLKVMMRDLAFWKKTGKQSG
jgi:hypothetical protein